MTTTTIDQQTQTCAQEIGGKIEDRFQSLTVSTSTAPFSSFTPSFDPADRCTSVDVVVTELRANVSIYAGDG